jgi:hypothetical protein
MCSPIDSSHTASQTSKTAGLVTGPYSVYFRLRTGVKWQVENCKADMTIQQLKELIAKHDKGIPANEQRLSFNGNPLKDANTLGYVRAGARH